MLGCLGRHSQQQVYVHNAWLSAIPEVVSTPVALQLPKQPGPEEQPAAQVLPSQTLLAPNTSTVALNLAPTSGQSSHSLLHRTNRNCPTIEPPTQPAAETIEAAVVPELPKAAPTGSIDEIAVQVVQEASVPKPLTPSTLAGVPEAMENQEVVTNREPKPVEKVMAASVRSKRSISSDALAVVATPLEFNTSTVAPQRALQKSQTATVKEVKQQIKKKLFGIPPLKSFGSFKSLDGNSTDNLGNAAAAKPKKMPRLALAGRFKNVTGQMR
ncbi:hypothetical protein PCANC_19704 [Puccinia coronata f. sp. avenae]|uniref:Uncharacterized protein n=1 Tax=Puccinia coronata f. sp. avenae TaxID=200324 RepID=A0A2N5SAX8_9BASI|nr:hypothetical protein PCANC_19704 [Puccinia coronata f. sp. avenae]